MSRENKFNKVTWTALIAGAGVGFCFLGAYLGNEFGDKWESFRSTVTSTITPALIYMAEELASTLTPTLTSTLTPSLIITPSLTFTPFDTPTSTSTSTSTSTPENFLGNINGCKSLTDKSQITNDQEISWFDGFASAPPVPDLYSMVCWALQMREAQNDGIIKQSSDPEITSDIVSWQKINTLTQGQPDLVWSEGPTENLDSGRIISLSDAKVAGENFWQQVVRIVAHDTNTNVNDAENNPEAIRIFNQLIAGVLPGRNTEVIDTCKTHTASADTREKQPQVPVYAIWRSGVNVGDEYNFNGKEQLSDQATLAQVFVTYSPQEADETRRDLQDQKIFFTEATLPSGRIAFSVVLDAESEGPNTLGVDSNPNNIGDLGQLVPCGVGELKIPTNTPEKPARPEASRTPQPKDTPVPSSTETRPAPTPSSTPAQPTPEVTLTPSKTPEPTSTNTVTQHPSATVQPPTEAPTMTPAPTEIGTPTQPPTPTERPTWTPIPTNPATLTPFPTEHPSPTPWSPSAAQKNSPRTNSGSKH